MFSSPRRIKLMAGQKKKYQHWKFVGVFKRIWTFFFWKAKKKTIQKIFYFFLSLQTPHIHTITEMHLMVWFRPQIDWLMRWSWSLWLILNENFIFILHIWKKNNQRLFVLFFEFFRLWLFIQIQTFIIT